MSLHIGPVNRLASIAVLAAAYIGTIVAANWAVSAIPPLPLILGIAIPGGVWFVAVTLTLRDSLHHQLGGRWAAGLVVAGAVLSWPLAGRDVAVAATVGFLIGGLLDQVVYWSTLKTGKPRWVAVALSNAVGLVVDSVVFVTLAQDTLRQFGIEPWKLIVGQIIGKAVVTALVAWVIKHRDVRRARLHLAEAVS